MGISVFAAEQADSEGYPETLLAEAKAAGTIDSPAMNELLKRYEPLVMTVVRSMGRPASAFDDLVNGGRWGLVQAVLHHDGRDTGLTSYLKLYIRGEAEQAVKRQRTADVPTEDEAMPAVESTIGVPETVIDNEMWFDTLSPKQNRLVLARYRDDKALLDIATTDGCSVSAVSQRLRTIKKTLADTYASVA